MVYCFFRLKNIPDLELSKYKALDSFSIDSLLSKQGVFLRQLYKYSMHNSVSFHFVYCFNPNSKLGERLSVIFFASSDNEEHLKELSVFCSNSVISQYFNLELIDESFFENIQYDSISLLTKDYLVLPVLNRISTTDSRRNIDRYSIKEWTVNENGRIYDVLKLMEGFNDSSAIRIDLKPVNSVRISKSLDEELSDLNKRIKDYSKGRDYNSEILLNSIIDFRKDLLNKQFFKTNIIAFSADSGISNLLCNTIAAGSVKSGSYRIVNLQDNNRVSILTNIDQGFDDKEIKVLSDNNPQHKILNCLNLFSIEELKSIVQFPVLYPGENLDLVKESEPSLVSNENSILLGKNEQNHKVFFSLENLSKHAFITGVPGSGKTNTMLHIISELWIKYRIPFLVFEPAKREYRALFNMDEDSMKDMHLFSPNANTRFPLHINPFAFPVGLTLAEHITNLNTIFAGAFELIPPTPIILDQAIEKVYIDKGWRIHQINNGKKPYPTIQDLYNAFKSILRNVQYDEKTKLHIQTFLELRIGGLLNREIGDVYNVSRSTIKPEEWTKKPAILELESLGEGPANFMVLLISTYVRETLSINNCALNMNNEGNKTIINHVILFEEAHNLIGVRKENLEDKVDPKIAATNYVVKMLAEVRALGEGIIIADQLPSVMAPEVLKNTGLKIVHRLTAADDRKMVSSTMSASDSQINEQVTYSKGQSLVFYEGLIKPFKLQVSKWQECEQFYQSLSDYALSQKLIYNAIYMSNMKKSLLVELDRIKTKQKQSALKLNLVQNLDMELPNREHCALFYDLNTILEHDINGDYSKSLNIFINTKFLLLNDSLEDMLEEYGYISRKYGKILSKIVSSYIILKWLQMWLLVDDVISYFFREIPELAALFKTNDEIIRSLRDTYYKRFGKILSNYTLDSGEAFGEKDYLFKNCVDGEINEIIEVINNGLNAVVSKGSFPQDLKELLINSAKI